MAVATTQTDKALVASSEFDPSAFVKGIDAMTAAMVKLLAQEDQLRADLKNIDAALKANRTEYKATQDQIAALDKTSKTYADDLAKLNAQQTTLKTQQKALNDSIKTNTDALSAVSVKANEYRTALNGISTTAKQVTQENKGKTLFDVAGLNRQVQEVAAAGGKLRNVFNGKIPTAELDKFEAALADTKDEMKQLDQVVTFVKEKLDTLDPNTQEFQELNTIVQTGEQVLQTYGETLETTGKQALSLRGQLRQMREELSRLEEQGLDNTEEFERMAVEAGKLQDQIGDTQQRIKVLSSDTKNLDFGIGAIRGVAAAYGVAEGAAGLFGLKSEDVAESLQRLNAIMLVLNGLQEIQNLLQKQSVVSIVGQQIATTGAAAAQRVYAIAVGTSTGAMRAFRLALLATGIGAFVVLLGVAIEAMSSLGGETENVVDQNNLLNESLERTNLLLDSNTKSIQANAAIKEEQLRRTAGFVANPEQAIRQQEALDRKLAENKQKALQKERAVVAASLADIRKQQDDFLNSGASGDAIEKTNAQALQLTNRLIDIDDTLRIEKEKNLTKTFQDAQKAREREYNATLAFLDRLSTLQREYRDKTLAAQPQDEAAIREAFKNSLADATADLEKEVAQGKLTKQRGKILTGIIRDINKVDLTQAIREFREQSEEAERSLANSIFDIRLRNGEQRAELIREQFTREAALVRINARNQSEQLIRERDELIRGVEDTATKGLISPEAARQNIERLQDLYAQLLENLATQTTRKQEEISARVFESAQNEVTRIFTGASLIVSQATTAEIQKLAQQYQRGAITYAEFQKELTRITTEESTKRLRQNLREREELLRNAQTQLKTEQDPGRQKELTDKITALQIEIDSLKRQLDVAEVEETNADRSAIVGKIQELATYAQAVGGIVNQVVEFWAQANEAEERSLERSIALQERRVDAATRLAERGNSEYLRLEEDRLNELQVKQENAARRQLAINAVLQTSQALVAFVTALAQGIATGGPLGGIAIAGAVIAAIGAGYAIISSLSSENTQTLKRGTKSVRREGHPAGVDTVPAMLTEGEAVLPVDVNKAYEPAVAAIYDKAIPADVINNFVSNYPKKETTNMVNNYRVNNRVFPRLDHNKMHEVTQVVVNYPTELLNATKEQTRKLDENAELLRTLDKSLKGIGMHVNVDKDGLAVSLMKTLEQFQRNKKA